MNLIPNVKVVQILFWLIYIPLGLWTCQHVGISWDEGIELFTYKVNLEALLGLMRGDLGPYHALLAYGDRYYGIGFHMPANLLSYLIETTILPSSGTMEEAHRITLNHIAIFISWAGSGYLVGLIIKRITNDVWVSTLGMIGYLLWPYLLGHGLMNIKDIPFLFAWLLCTNQILQIANGSLNHSLLRAYATLGIFTGWLLSIRVSGLLIGIEYLAFLLIFWSYHTKGKRDTQLPVEYGSFTKSKIFVFILTTFITLFVCYPVLWHNPLEILQAISYMSRHPWDGNTLTAGRLIAGSQLSWYIAAWLAVKLPLIVILGLVICPIILYNFLSEKWLSANLSQSEPLRLVSNQAYWAAGTIAALLLAVIFILLALVIKNVLLYNELRQILFIFPLLWIIAISSLRFINRKLTLGALLASIALFTWDNLKLFPYQYVYFNEISRQFSIIKQFEKDYFGLSATQSAKWLNQNIQANTIASITGCVYVTPLHLWQYAIDNQKVTCIKDFSERPQNELSISNGQLTEMNYWIGVLVRDKEKALPIPRCSILRSEERTLPLSSQTLIMGELYVCKP